MEHVWNTCVRSKSLIIQRREKIMCNRVIYVERKARGECSEVSKESPGEFEKREAVRI